MKSFHLAVGVVLCTLAMVCFTGCAGEGTAEDARATSTLVLPAAGAPAPFGDAQFVTKWMVLGPITFAEGDFGGDQQQGAIDHEFIADESALDGTQAAPQGVKWQAKQFQGGMDAGRIDLDELYSQPEHAVAYAVAWVDCPQDMTNTTLLVGSDDYIKVWINDKLVHTYKTERRAGSADQDTISNIHLKKGLNRVVVKCVDVVYDWNFFLRFTTADGKPLATK